MVCSPCRGPATLLRLYTCAPACGGLYTAAATRAPVQRRLSPGQLVTRTTCHTDNLSRGQLVTRTPPWQPSEQWFRRLYTILLSRYLDIPTTKKMKMLDMKRKNHWIYVLFWLEIKMKVVCNNYFLHAVIFKACCELIPAYNCPLLVEARWWCLLQSNKLRYTKWECKPAAAQAMLQLLHCFTL